MKTAYTKTVYVVQAEDGRFLNQVCDDITRDLSDVGFFPSKKAAQEPFLFQDGDKVVKATLTLTLNP